MALAYRTALIPTARRQRPGYKMTPTSITVHDTATPNAPADNFARYQARENLGSSFHIAVDDREAVLLIPISEQAWHSGTSAGNTTSIAIEVCEFTDAARRAAAERNAQQLISDMLTGRAPAAFRTDHLSVANVRTHKSWSGKNCPRLLLPRWDAFIAGIRGLIAPAPATPPTPAPSVKTVAQLADEVIAGKHGSGDARRRSLGSLYSAVQAEVNRRLLGRTAAPTPKKSIVQLADEVIAGKHGTGDARRRSLGNQYAAVQAEVNRRLGAK